MLTAFRQEMHPVPAIVTRADRLLAARRCGHALCGVERTVTEHATGKRQGQRTM